jgi:hypothetical protein
MDWRQFVNDMVYLHQEGLDLENDGTTNYSKIRIGAKIIPWSLETTNTKLINLGMEAPYLSTQTIVEKCPDADPNEVERIIAERGSLISRNDQTVENNADKATSMAKNRNDIIRDNEDKIEVEPAQINS